MFRSAYNILHLLLFVLFCSLQGLPTAASAAEQAKENAYLNHFMELFSSYCYLKQNPEAVTTAVTADDRFFPSKTFFGVYEEMFENISYAVTPDPTCCTVDVMLQPDDRGLLFTMDEIQAAVEQLGTYAMSFSQEGTQRDAEGKEVKEKYMEFLKNSNQVKENPIVLTYPLTRQDSYFMTLNYYYQ